MSSTRVILAGQALRGLYAITDTTLMPGRQLLVKAEAALRGGCRILQYRNKTASTAEQKREAQQLRDLCRHYQCLFIVNDYIALAQQVQADGVHIGQTDTPLAQVKKQLGDTMIIGVSCHGSVEQAKQAEQQGANYVAFGRFFPSHTKPQAPAADIAVLVRAKKELKIPIVAIGGITRDNAPRVIEQGADAIAVIHDLFVTDDPADIEARAKTFTHLF